MLCLIACDVFESRCRGGKREKQRVEQPANIKISLATMAYLISIEYLMLYLKFYFICLYL